MTISPPRKTELAATLRHNTSARCAHLEVAASTCRARRRLRILSAMTSAILAGCRCWCCASGARDRTLRDQVSLSLDAPGHSHETTGPARRGGEARGSRGARVTHNIALYTVFGARGSRGRGGRRWQGPCFLWNFMSEHGPRHRRPPLPQESLASVPLYISDIVRHPSAPESSRLPSSPLRASRLVRESVSIETKGD